MLFKKHMKKEETSTPKTSDMSVAAQAKAASLSALKEKKIEEEQKEKEPKRTKPKSGAVQPVRGAASTTSGVKRPSIKSSETSPAQHPKMKKTGLSMSGFLSRVVHVLHSYTIGLDYHILRCTHTGITLKFYLYQPVELYTEVTIRRFSL